MKVLGGSITLVLLAGGYNERLRRTEKSLPKSLVPLPNVPPVMVLLADQFIRAGARVVVVCDSLAAQMFKLLYPSMALSVKVLEDDFVGTGRALHIAVEAARSRLVLVANADTIVPVDLATWCPSVEIDSPIHQLLVPQSVQNSGLIGVDPCDGQVRHWGETIGRAPAGRLQHASSTGVYLIDRNSWLSWPDARGESLEREVLPEAVSQGLREERSPQVGCRSSTTAPSTGCRSSRMTIGSATTCWRQQACTRKDVSGHRPTTPPDPGIRQTPGCGQQRAVSRTDRDRRFGRRDGGFQELCPAGRARDHGDHRSRQLDPALKGRAWR